MKDPREVLAEVASRAEKATPGPWLVTDLNEGMREYGPFWEVANDAYYNPPADEGAPWLAVELHTGLEEDARFIAAARSDVPRLVAALTAVLDEHLPVKRATSASSMPGYETTYREVCLSCECTCLTYPCPTVRVITKALEGGSS